MRVARRNKGWNEEGLVIGRSHLHETPTVNNSGSVAKTLVKYAGGTRQKAVGTWHRLGVNSPTILPVP